MPAFFWFGDKLAKKHGLLQSIVCTPEIIYVNGEKKGIIFYKYMCQADLE